MKLYPKILCCGAALLLGGCASPDQKTTAQENAEDDTTETAPASVGSHIRGKSKARPTKRTSGEEFQRANAAERTDTPADEIISKRN